MTEEDMQRRVRALRRLIARKLPSKPAGGPPIEPISSKTPIAPPWPATKVGKT